MGKISLGLALAVPLLAVSPANADPQMLGVIETASAVSLHCSTGTCTAELTSICLHEARATPTRGYPYTAHNPEAITLTGTRSDGSTVRLQSTDILQFTAERGFHTVRVNVSEADKNRLGLVSLAVKVEQPLTLVPAAKIANDPNPLTEADIELGAGPMRRTAEAIVDRDTDTMHASQVIARMIDALPRYGKATAPVRADLWKNAAASHVPSYSRVGVHKAKTAYNRCYRQTRIGDKNLRGCLAEVHDTFLQDLNTKYWDAVKAGS